MQIELLDTFLDLAETRSFRRTAERLGLTQSTVSGRVATLEAALGHRLFRRSRAGTELTTEGMKFEPHARGLRRDWAAARRAVREAGDAAFELRLGIQHDLAGPHIGDWVSEFRRALPQTAFYIELDYSAQTCTEVLAGGLDFGLIYTPKPLPDLHFETVGEVRYRLVSTGPTRRAELAAAGHIRADYSPAFRELHRAAVPELAETPLASGQNAAVAGLLAALGGSAYVLEETAAEMAAAGLARPVEDVAPIGQPVYAVVHIRNRPAALQRRLLAIVRRRLAAR